MIQRGKGDREANQRQVISLMNSASSGCVVKPMEKKQQTFSVWYFLIALLTLFMIQIVLLAPDPKTLSYSDFKTLEKEVIDRPMLDLLLHVEAPTRKAVGK